MTGGSIIVDRVQCPPTSTGPCRLKWAALGASVGDAPKVAPFVFAGSKMLGYVSTLLMFVICVSVAAESRGQWIVAHRGASHDAPENTLAAFELAWRQQADAVEGDFYLTADDQIVCIHDRTTKRTTGVDKPVNECTMDELRELEAGSWKDEKWRGERLPTFAEVLAAVPADKHFVIELKVGPEIVPALSKELEGLGSAERGRLVIISFHADTVSACKRRFPAIRAHWLTGFKQDKKTGQWSPDAASIARSVAACGADGVGMNGKREVIDASFIEQLREGGCDEFHVWTIDSPADAAFFKGLGAVAITTNRPAYIRESLE